MNLVGLFFSNLDQEIFCAFEYTTNISATNKAINAVLLLMLLLSIHAGGDWGGRDGDGM